MSAALGVPLSALLFAVGILAGALNAVAGGGSFLTLPALLYAGVSPVAANATSTFAVWPASVASVLAYRRNLASSRRGAIWLSVVSLAGGLAGAILLVRTSDAGFMRLLPWLMLLATLAFTFADRLTGRLLSRNPQRLRSWALPVQFLIATYGGYFGGGMGILTLATLGAAGMTDLHEMNGLKSVLGVAINAVALALFVVEGSVVFRPGIAMAVGGIVGGYAGAAVARRFESSQVKIVVIAVGWAMTLLFFWSMRAAS